MGGVVRQRPLDVYGSLSREITFAAKTSYNIDFIRRPIVIHHGNHACVWLFTMAIRHIEMPAVFCDYLFDTQVDGERCLGVARAAARKLNPARGDHETARDKILCRAPVVQGPRTTTSGAPKEKCVVQSTHDALPACRAPVVQTRISGRWAVHD
jgi:hypothetical protein